MKLENVVLVAGCALVGAVVAFATTVTISPNMGMPVPVVGSTPGPEWANDINASLSIIDSHDHSPGHGVQITPDGIDINADLDFADNYATSLKATRFDVQGSPLSGGSDLNETYVSGVDLYYNDGNGNQVRITNGGNVNAGAGSITGLPSGTASVAFAGSTYTFQSATSTPANMNVGPVAIGTNVASSKTVTIAPPGALAANYSLTTFNGLPAATSLVTLDSSGQLAASPTTTATFGDGSAATPSITFSGDTNTGIYHPAADQINFSTAGTYRALISDAEVDFGGVSGAYFPSGSVTAPGVSFSTDSNTGIYQTTGDEIRFSTAGVYRALISAAEADFTGTATVAVPSGTSAAPGIVIGGGGDTGFYRTSNTVGVSTSGTARMTVASTGVATTVPLTVTATGAVTITGTGGNTPHACTRRTNSGVGVSNETVTCSASEIVTGGGCLPGGAGNIQTSRPDTTASWECVYSGSGNVTAYAICCLQ